MQKFKANLNRRNEWFEHECVSLLRKVKSDKKAADAASLVIFPARFYLELESRGRRFEGELERAVHGYEIARDTSLAVSIHVIHRS